MTDHLDPRPDQLDRVAPDDDTTRMAAAPVPESPDVPTTGVEPVPTTPVAPTSPLTPASRPNAASTIYENEVAWATSAPVVVEGSGAPKRRRGRLRWAAALAVVALVIGTSVAVAALITGASSTATVLGYVPEQTIMYGEVRLDLPGDQKRAVGEFLSKFPGFADQASLDTKLDEVLDDLIKDASNGEQSYTGNIKSWFDGELAFSLGPLPKASTLMGGDIAAMSSFRALALVSVKDPTAAAAWFAAAFDKAGATSTTETYQGVTVTVFDDPSGIKTAYALIDGKVAVFGDLASVKDAIDTKGGGGFAKEPGPEAALDSASGDHVGFVYVALRPLLDWSTDAQKSMSELGGGAVATEVVSDAMLKLIPAWAGYWLSFESDAIVMEATAPKAETTIGSTENRTSSIVEHVPATAILASVSHDVGKTVGDTLDLYGSEPALKPILDQLNQGLGLVGGHDAAFGWLGDTAIVVTDANGTPEGGLVAAATDKEAPARLITALKTFLALGGSQQGITIREETYNGTTITIVDIGDLNALTGESATMFALPISGHLEIAVAVTDDIVVIGSGPGFVKSVLDTTSGTSLASTDGYKKLADQAGKGTGATYLALDTIREMYEKSFATEDPAGYKRYETEVEPFLAPFDSLFVGSSIDGDLGKSVVIITVQ